MARPGKFNPTQEQLTKLRTAVRNKFKQDVADSVACKQLAEDIYYRTRTLISYNTLRRFFNLIPNSKVSISYSTYRLLIQYCGFQSEDSFFANNGTFTHTDLEEYFRNILHFNEVDFTNTVRNIICEHEFNPHRYDFICKCLLWAHGKEYYSFFVAVFTFDKLLERDKHNEVDLFNFSQTYGMLLNKMDEGIRIDIVNQICALKAGRQIFVEQFVDISNIEFYYTNTIQTYLQWDDSEVNRLFYYGVSCFYFFVKNQEKEFKECYTLLWRSYNPAMRLPTLLMSRLLSCDILAIHFKLATKKDYLKKLFSYSKKYIKNENIYLCNYPLMMCMITDNRTLFKHTADFLLSSAPTHINDYFAHHISCNLKLYSAFNYYLHGSINESLALMNDIRPELFAKYEEEVLKKCLFILKQHLNSQ